MDHIGDRFSGIAALTSTLEKIGVEGVDPIFGTGIRISVVVVMTWAMIFLFNKQDRLRSVERKDVLFSYLVFKESCQRRARSD